MDSKKSSLLNYNISKVQPKSQDKIIFLNDNYNFGIECGILEVELKYDQRVIVNFKIRLFNFNKVRKISSTICSLIKFSKYHKIKFLIFYKHHL